MKLKALCAFAIIAFLTAVAPSQAQRSVKEVSAPTYVDPQTGLVRSMTRVEPDASTTTTYTGTLKITLNLTIKSTWPTGAKPTYVCGASTTAMSENLTTYTFTDYSEIAYKNATVSGTTGTCTITIPYSWTLPAASSTEINTQSTSYTVEVINNDGTVASAVMRYSSAVAISSSSIPSAGTVTTKTISVVL